ncbi:MAG: Pyroglutamyl-peptidase [Planctomycetaceae bacterium]|nr:Pyroglutamyl-peptidase [Planctomycetaceae bacterium]
MPRRILITAFAPFGTWPENASELCLGKLLPLLSTDFEVTTRVYPVEFVAARPLLESDLLQNYDLAIHLGQAQNTARIRLEAVGLNVGSVPGRSESDMFGLVANGPAAYQSALPLTQWADKLRQEGIPAYVSYHAGTYLCNATLYWAHHFLELNPKLTTPVCFIHVPLDISQVVGLPGDYLTLPSQMTANAVARLIAMWDGAPGPSVL